MVSTRSSGPRFRLELPTVSAEFRSLRFVLMLPGVYIEYLENAPNVWRMDRVESGCRIGVYNPFARFDLGAELPILPSFWDLVRPRYVRSPRHPDTHWIEVPDGWTGQWEPDEFGREQPVI